MKFYLIFDFETTGWNDGADPINFPTEFACQLVTEKGTIVDQFETLVKGAGALSEWSKNNCPHVTIDKCNTEGIEIDELLKKILEVIGGLECVLVAHNLEYDWDKVLTQIVILKGLHGSPEYQYLKKCERMCTMINCPSAYYNTNRGKWCGPSLANLADSYKIPFDNKKAHNAMYDVKVTRKCLVQILNDKSSTTRKRIRIV